MRTAPLNVFQRLARTWDDVHPYNAGQACRVAAGSRQASPEVAWKCALGDLGLGRVELRRGGYGFEPAPGMSVRELAGDDELGRHFTAELNRPFLDPAEPPFRPFVQVQGTSTWLGVVYQHWVADSVSVREILRAWVARLRTPDVASRPSHPSLVHCRSRDLVRGWRGDWSAGGTLLGLLRRYGEYRHARKIHTFGPLEYPVRVQLLQTEADLLPRLLAYARRLNVTLNDVALAALAEASHRLIPSQQRLGRADLAVSTVADLRPGLAPALRGGFGCLLGFTTTVCRRRDLDDWDCLLRAVGAQSRVQRAAGVGPASVLWMLAAEVAARFTPPERVYDFYRKEVPLAAGISNVNLNGTWAAADPAVLDYVRVSPTGPIVPVALALTSLRDELHLSLTYRTALLNDWTATELAQSFTRRLGQVARAG